MLQLASGWHINNQLTKTAKMSELNDATVEFKGKVEDGNVVIKSPAKNRLKGTKLTPDAHAVTTKQPLFFERAASSWWNPCFDSDILEEQYRKNYYKTTRRRFQFSLLYIIVACISWVIYFGALQLDNWVMYLSGAVACCIVTLIAVILTFTPVYPKFSLPIAVLLSLIVCSFLLLSAQTFTDADLSPVAGFTGSAEILILMYTLIPLPLFVAVIIGLLHSAVFEVLSVVSGLSTVNFVPARILLHLGIHLIGIHIYYISQARKRSTFLKVGQSIMSRRDLEIEKQLKQRMIHSLMPPTVAEEVMKANVSKGDKENEDELHTHGQPSGPGQQIRFRNFHMSQMTDVSILFADIVGFTKMSSNKTAEHLVSLLNDLFGRFDVLCDKSNCEKISTLGDCYYCVSGCPTARPDHAQCCIEMGVGMCRAIQEFDSDHNEEVNMRVGVHTGDVLCGLVGTRRFKFDVFSNDVTLANMMESEGAPGRVHISESTLSFVKDDYNVEAAKEVPGKQWCNCQCASFVLN